MHDRQKESSRSANTFTSLDINTDNHDDWLQPAFVKSFEALNGRLARMIGETEKLRSLTESLGRAGDSHSLRQTINGMMAKISREISATGDDLKRLSANSHSRAEKQRLRQLAVEYRQLLDTIERLDRLVIERCQIFVQQARSLSNRTAPPNILDTEASETSPLVARHDQQQQKQVDLNGIRSEIAYNEALILEREAEIQNIGRASNLINELFQHIGILVSEQQDLVDNIEVNAELTMTATRQAARHVERTHEQHRRKTSRICFIIIFVVIAAVFVMTVLASIL